VPALFHRLSRKKRDALAGSFRKVSSELRDVARQTERDFLDVGGKLQMIVTHARAESETLSSIMESLAGEEGRNLSMALDEVISWASGVRDTGGRGGTLTDLGPVVVAVRAPLEQMRGAARMLRVTGVVTRVESARLGSHASGFVSVADEVARLAADIEGKSDSVLGAVEGLRLLIERTGETVLVAERRQNRDLMQLLTECRVALEELHGRQEQFCAVSMRARAGYERIVDGVGRVVMALQFHDSTRQRLEHVDEALTALATKLELPGSDLGDLAAAVELQAAQVEEARRAFLDSLAKIRADLQAMQLASTELACAARELVAADASGDAESTSGRHFSAVVNTIGEWTESRRLLAAAAGEVAGGCGRVGGFVNDIQAVGTRLLRLALNAQVEAVRLADSGAVMEAVAEGIRGVSHDASGHAQKAGLALVDAEAGVAALAQSLGADAGSAGGRAQAAAACIRTTGAKMEAGAAQTTLLLSTIVDRGEEISTQIASLIAGLTADVLMDRVTGSCLEILTTISRTSGSRLRRSPHPDGTDLMAAAEMYTMQHEREVHAALTGVDVACPPEAGPGPDSSLGSDVEIF